MTARVFSFILQNKYITKHKGKPSHWDIGKVYKRLILMVSKGENQDVIQALEDVYSSFISELIEDYNSSFYYDNPQSIYATYLNGEVIKEL